MRIIKHPSAQRRFKLLAERFQRVRKEHDTAVKRMWAGTLAMSFTDEELGLLTDYLSPADQALMKEVRKVTDQ